MALKGPIGLLIFTTVLLAGCATPHAGQMTPEAQSLYAARTSLSDGSRADPKGAGNVLSELLKRPVNGDAAVQIALLNNPRVTGIYARIGFAEADLYDAARLSNPILGYTRLTSGSDGSKVDWSLSQNFTELLFLRYRRAGAESQALLAKQQVARELLDLEAEVRAADVRFIGSRTIAAMRGRVAQTTRVSAAYAQQLFDAGNISAVQLARMQEAATLAEAGALRARSNETTDRNALLTMLGLTSDTPVDLAGDYALPAAGDLKVEEISRSAADNRLDLLSAREALRFATLAQLHARRWRWLGDTSIGIARERDGAIGAVPAETLSGPSVSVALPIFNQGQGTVSRAQAAVTQLNANVRSLELSIANEVPSRMAALEAAQKTAVLYREQILPTQKLIVEESQKQQNYMLIGTFELLAAKQHQIEGYEAYIDALRDYWLAHIDLVRTTGGRFPGLATAPDGRAIEPLAYNTIDSGEHP